MLGIKRPKLDIKLPKIDLRMPNFVKKPQKVSVHQKNTSISNMNFSSMFNKPSSLKNAPIKMQNQWKNMSITQRGVNRILKPDFDKDGVPNRWDCRPMDPKRQEYVYKGKTYPDIVHYPYVIKGAKGRPPTIKMNKNVPLSEKKQIIKKLDTVEKINPGTIKFLADNKIFYAHDETYLGNTGGYYRRDDKSDKAMIGLVEPHMPGKELTLLHEVAHAKEDVARRKKGLKNLFELERGWKKVTKPIEKKDEWNTFVDTYVPVGHEKRAEHFKNRMNKQIYKKDIPILISKGSIGDKYLEPQEEQFGISDIFDDNENESIPNAPIEKHEAVQKNPVIIKAYHGTPDMRFLEEFNPEQTGYYPELPEAKPDNTEFIKTYGGIKGGFSTRNRGAIFFTDKKKVAETYAKEKGAWDYQNSIPFVAERFLVMKNPKIIDKKGEKWSGTDDEVKVAKKEGYDGIIIKNTKDKYYPSDTDSPHDNFVVFNPKQILTKDEYEKEQQTLDIVDSPEEIEAITPDIGEETIEDLSETVEETVTPETYEEPVEEEYDEDNKY